jgi:beta-glucosidase
MSTTNFEARARELVSQMTPAEKISQMMHGAPAIERLNIPAYNWWNECLHGVGRAGIATVFPQAIGMAASWNVPLLHQIAVAISDEARAKHHEFLRNDIHDIYTGLTFWTPNINIFRDPRWGRGQETYGEDPYLTSRMGVTFVKGLQGDDPTYLKVVATPKHYAVHSGPEHDRHVFDVHPSERDLWETYLPAFEATIREGKAASIMGAYNRVFGEPANASHLLLEDILRTRWGFEGYVVSDCWAITDIYKHHQVVATAAEAAALAVKAGCDLECGDVYPSLNEALELGLIDEATIDTSLIRLFTARFQLGMFDAPEEVAYAQIPPSVVDSAENRALALRIARESMVLLKNDFHTLPLSKDIASIAIIGPNADDPEILLGNYNGTPSHSVTPLAGMRAKLSPKTVVNYARGCGVFDPNTDGFAEALSAAQSADVVIFVGGLSQAIEGEEGQVEGLPAGLVSQGDRIRIDLPDVQEDLLKALHATGKPIVLVLLNGSAVAVNWADANLPAILEAWYPGEEGGTAIADVLFGDYNPGGRLPLTFYKSADDLPDFTDYSMTSKNGRTYRYFTREPLYPFGYGLSYTDFDYSNLTLSASTISDGGTLTISVDVTNIGDREGDEVVQLYLRAGRDGYPLRQLAGFARVPVKADQTLRVDFTLTSVQFTRVTDAGERVLDTGAFTVYVGGGQPGFGEGLTVQVEVV